MENKSHAFVAGLFALLLGVAAIVAVAWLTGDRQVMRSYTVVTRYHVGGLNPQAQVRYRGIRVGKVEKIQLDAADPSNILIDISIDANVPVRRDTVAQLNYQGVTGLAHVLLMERSAGEPATPGEDSPTQIPMIPSLFDEVSEGGVAALGHARHVLAAVETVFNDENRQHLARTLANLDTVSGRMTPALDQLNTALGQVNKLLDDRAVANASQAVADTGLLIRDTRELVAQMRQTTDRFDVAIGDAAGGGASALMPRLNELAADFSTTSRQLSRVLRLLEDTPQGLVFGVPVSQPGPGEPGFSAQEQP